MINYRVFVLQFICSFTFFASLSLALHHKREKKKRFNFSKIHLVVGEVWFDVFISSRAIRAPASARVYEYDNTQCSRFAVNLVQFNAFIFALRTQYSRHEVPLSPSLSRSPFDLLRNFWLKLRYSYCEKTKHQNQLTSIN